MTDAMRVKQSLAGDESSFELLVLRYQRPLFGLIFHVVHDDDLACDKQATINHTPNNHLRFAHFVVISTCKAECH
jgi:hypothetical protein